MLSRTSLVAALSSLRLAAPALLMLGVIGPIGGAWAQDSTIVFSATGDVPYGSSEIPVFQQQIQNHNKYSPSEVFVHVGDIKSSGDPCIESRYSDMAGYLKALKVPAYIVLGDNEWNDCSDPTTAFTYWTSYFTDFESNFCGASPTEHQSVRHENWAFVRRGVLFIGIDLPSAPIYPNISTWNARLQDNADWCSQQFTSKGSQVRAAVVFSQAGPSSVQDYFFDRFRPAAAAFGKPVLFLHGDGHSWLMDHPWPEPNLLRVQVNQGGAEDPVQVTVDMDPTDPWVFLRNPWSGSPQVYNAPPCVEAGPDLAVVLPASASLSARASDDGDPSPPGTVALTWSQTSGPGTVSFANVNAASTTASFTTPGPSVLRLTAFDGALTTYDELSVAVGPVVSIGDASVVEGPTGSTVNATFTVTLVNGSGGAVSVPWSTGQDTAGADEDYATSSGTVNLSGTSDSQTVTVVVNGDADVEPDETFYVNLGSPSGGATLGKSQGVGTIQNDDLPLPPVVDSFLPVSGGAGTQVTVAGSQFTGATSVKFNGVAGTGLIVDSDTQVRATVPSSATTGPIAVTGPGGTGQSVASFTVLGPTPLTFIPPDDAQVKSSSPTTNYGSLITIRGRSGDPTYNSYLKFNVVGLGGTVQSAKLRLYCTDASNEGGKIHLVSNNYLGTTTPWLEGGLIWNNAPAIGGTPLDQKGAVSLDTWVEFDVASAIVGDGTYSFGLLSGSTNSVYYSSTEGTNPPQLVVQVAPNQAPVLAGIGDRTVEEDSLLSFIATATDADAGQALTFSLDSGAPAGATINGLTGAFSWTPTSAQVGQHPVTVRVTDSGSPALSDFELITVTVNDMTMTAVLDPIANVQVLPRAFALRQNHPNPFNPETSIRLELPRPGTVRLTVYDSMGGVVKTLVDGYLPAGFHEVSWNALNSRGRRVSSGVYFLRLEAQGFRSTRKASLMR